MDQLLDFEGRYRVQRGAGLVEQDNLRLDGDGAGDHQSLLLAAGQSERRLLQTVLDLVPQRRSPQRPLHRLIEHPPLVDALNAQPIGHVLENGLGEGVRLLKHHANPPAQLGDIDFLLLDVFTGDEDLAFSAATVDQVVHAVEATQQCRLAAATGSDERSDLPAGNIKLNIPERLYFVVEQVQFLYPNRRLTHRFGRGSRLGFRQVFQARLYRIAHVSNPLYFSRNPLRTWMATMFSSRMTTTRSSAVA